MRDSAVLLFKFGREIMPIALHYYKGGHTVLEKDVLHGFYGYQTLSLGRTRQMPENFIARMTGIALMSDPENIKLIPVSKDVVMPATGHAYDRGMRELTPGDAGVAIFEPDMGVLTWVKGTGYGAEHSLGPKLNLTTFERYGAE